MPYEERVAARLRAAVLRAGPAEPVDERKMFGGVALMLAGNMACGVIGAELMVRVAPEDAEEALRRPHARPMDFTGKPLRGFVYVAPDGFASDAELDAWVGLALAGARAASEIKANRRSTKAPRRPAKAAGRPSARAR
jgi:TfoX/Sxy family transcriptional regulator of competence genes